VRDALGARTGLDGGRWKLTVTAKRAKGTMRISPRSKKERIVPQAPAIPDSIVTGTISNITETGNAQE